MKALAKRLYIGLAGLGGFWALGMLSVNELAKTGVLMTACLLGLVGLLALGKPRRRWISAVSIALYLLFFLDAAIKGFLRDYFGLRPNHSMVLQAILNTNPGESNEFFLHNWREAAQAVLAFLAITILAIYMERRLYRTESGMLSGMPPARTSRSASVTVFTMLALFIAMHFNPTMAKENPLLFWPIRYSDYQQQLAAASAMQHAITSNMAQRADWKVEYYGAHRNTVVWVIGESFNRSNMSLYGYPRRTTPKLDAMRDQLIVFKDVLSSEPATMTSLMKMLTPATLEDPEAWNKKPDVLMLAEEAGYKTYWLSNQVPNDGWLGLVSRQADERVFINKGSGRGENNFDGNLLAGFDRALADDAPKKLIVVHLLGAHPTYDMRYPKEFAQFDGMDDAVSKMLTDAGRSMWIRQQRNEYDNAIAYGDHVLGNLIQSTIKATPDHAAALLFSSDHAQEVGHTRDHAGQSVVDKSGYEIPMIVWSQALGGLDVLRKSVLEQRPHQTDHLEHTVLGLLHIRSDYYDATHDILSDRYLSRIRQINGVDYALEMPSQSLSPTAPVAPVIRQ
ncbi:MAG: phosphoethanolamine transferase [Collimonas fungivorans]|uniref:phosphoethanolamine transferase n=1 Tax=Collimonas fungivorans TaxID=158899 RepID=UPI0026ED4EBB|nr:phosphoethanolamine transferase [Collimonas fungivorans]MDB5768362.1 phosphoethanolamine transferase [Collimonas fungivorans]